MGSLPKFQNQSSRTPIETSRRVGPESQTGGPETHALNVYEQKGSKSMLLIAAATGENSGMHRAKQQNLESAGEGERA